MGTIVAFIGVTLNRVQSNPMLHFFNYSTLLSLEAVGTVFISTHSTRDNFLLTLSRSAIVITYKQKVGSRTYRYYTEQDLDDAMRSIKSG